MTPVLTSYSCTSRHASYALALNCPCIHIYVCYKVACWLAKVHHTGYGIPISTLARSLEEPRLLVLSLRGWEGPRCLYLIHMLTGNS